MFLGAFKVVMLTIGSHQGQGERGAFLVPPLIDSLMATRELGVFDGRSCGDKFGRASEAEAFFDIAPKLLHLLIKLGLKVFWPIFHQ